MAISDCIRTCRHCAVQFVRTSKGQPTFFCGHACRLEAKRAKDRLNLYPRKRKQRPCSVCGKPGLAKGLCAKHYFRFKAHGDVRSVCAMCGVLHEGEGRSYCSDACRLAGLRANQAKREAKRRAVEAEGDRIDPLRVFERDGWKCHLCGCKTRKDKRGTSHPMAPELDHVVTLADGGSHTWGNVACACKRCNQAKGAKSAGQLGLNIAA